DGLDGVSSAAQQSATLTGFRVPNTGYTGKLGVIAYEGDNTGVGDVLRFNNLALSDAQNPADNVFNSTRSLLGAAVSVAGDLPQLTGTPQSMSGIDLDVFDITAALSPGQTSAPVEASTGGDVYFLGAFITSISTFVPQFVSSTKTVTDIDGTPTVSGDVLKYTIQVSNSGNDASAGTVLTDVLPAGVTYVPGSLEVPGAKTDQPGDDEAEYDTPTRTVTVRLGDGADAMGGGSIAVNGTVSVSFRVKIDAGFTGTLSNQASISASGLLGAPNATTLTDSDLATPGASPTSIFVNQCASNANCTAPMAVCATDRSPAVCVMCLADSDCGNATSGLVCDTATETCQPGCRGTNGNGCPANLHCSSTDATVGSCDKCLTDAHCMNPTPVCSATNECTPCTADTDCTGKAAGELCVLDGTLAGACVQCTAANKRACIGTSPACDETTGKCVACVTDNDCADPARKRCDTTAHICVACLGKECEDAGAPEAGDPSPTPDAGGPIDEAPMDDSGEVGAAVNTGCGCRTTTPSDAGGRAATLGGLLLAITVAGARRASRSKAPTQQRK
ncbi:MAG: putative internalin, partial [Labilithrix sp.]|nr:putative internalin [Labilithrix sp.]